MNKSDLIAKMAEKSGLNLKQTGAALEAFLGTVTEALKEGDKVQIIGFGTFSVREREAREARNPATGAVITVAASKSPVFKPGKTFKNEF